MGESASVRRTDIGQDASGVVVAELAEGAGEIFRGEELAAWIEEEGAGGGRRRRRKVAIGLRSCGEAAEIVCGARYLPRQQRLRRVDGDGEGGFGSCSP